MTGWSWLWLVWIAAFFAIEGPALFNRTEGDTLSEHVWKWFGTRRADLRNDKGKTKGWIKVRRVVLLAFLTWLSLHFLTGGEFV